MPKTITYATLAAPTNLTATAAAGGTLTANTTYYYKVFAVFSTLSGTNYFHELGRSLMSLEVSATTTTTNLSIQLNWDAVAGAGGYRIHRCKGESIETTTTKMNTTLRVAVTTNSYLDTGADAQQMYHTMYRDGFEGKLTLAGGTLADPITMVDLYNADVAGGWGKIRKLSAVCYSVDVSWINLSSNNYMKWSGNLMILLNCGISAADTTAYTKIGEYDSATDSAYSGCCISFKNPNCLDQTMLPSTNTSIYDSTFIYDYASYVGYPLTGSQNYGSFTLGDGSVAIDCLFKLFRTIGANNNASLVRVKLIDGSENAWNWSATGTIKDITIQDTAIGIQYSGTITSVLDGVTLKRGAYIQLYSGNANTNVTIKNILIDTTKLSWYSSPLTVIKEAFDYKLTVKDVSGNPIASAKVKITDSAGTVLYNDVTDANGTIPQQALITRYLAYNYAATDPNNTSYHTGAAITTKNPFTIQISKNGYETYTEIRTVVSKEISNVFTLKSAIPLMIDTEGKLYPKINQSNEGAFRDMVIEGEIII